MLLAILAVAGVGAYFLFRKPSQAFPLYASGPVYGTGSGIASTPQSAPPVAPAATGEENGVMSTIAAWFTGLTQGEEKTPNEWRAALLPLIRAQEKSFAMPPGLLEAVIENESAFRDDIITGRTEGSAGEQGIMQLKPQFHMTSAAERNNPHLAIPYGATYLAKNFMRFGNWREAVIAYNCGPTDWANYGAAKCGPALSYVAKVERRIGSLA